MCIFTHTHTWTRSNVCMRTNIHSCIDTHTYASMHSNVHTHILISIHINRCASVQALCGHGGREEVRHARCPPVFARHTCACVHTHIHTSYIHTYIQTERERERETYIHTYIQTYIHTNLHTSYMNTNIHTCTCVHNTWKHTHYALLCCVCTFAGLCVRSLVWVSSLCVCPRVLVCAFVQT